MHPWHEQQTYVKRSVISCRANVDFIPATKLSLGGLAGCSIDVPVQATSPLFQPPLGAPFGPSVLGVAARPIRCSASQRWSASLALPALFLLCPLLTSPRYSMPITRHPASVFRSTGDISRGKTRYLHCIDAEFIKHTPRADGGLCCHVPARPRCVTPHIRFLFIASQFWIKLPSDPTSR